MDWIDPVYFEKLKKLQDPGQQDFLKELVESFATNMIDGLRTLRNLLASDSRKELVQLAHQLKSGALSLGARVVAERLRAIEDCGVKGAAASIAVELDEMEGEILASAAALRQLLGPDS